MSKVGVKIHGRDYWVKVVEMLQQNWALIDPADDGGAVVHFIDDRSGVFDQITFDSALAAESSLRRNGFGRFSEDKKAKEFLFPPGPPFIESTHPNGPIYSSGRFWK